MAAPPLRPEANGWDAAANATYQGNTVYYQFPLSDLHGFQYSPESQLVGVDTVLGQDPIVFDLDIPARTEHTDVISFDLTPVYGYGGSLITSTVSNMYITRNQ